MPRILTVFLSLLMLFGGSALCTTIYVPDTYPTIQAGIDAAADGDTVLVSDGIYTGDGNRDIDFNGKAIVLKSENGPEKAIIDCEGTRDEPHRGFHFHCGEDTNSVVDGFTIRGGFLFWINYPESAGGAIFCDSASPKVENCVLTDNFGRLGAVACYKSMAVFSGCTIGKNIPSYFEIFIRQSSPEFENCILADYYGIDLFHISYSDLPNLLGCNLFTVRGIHSLGSVADLIGVNDNFFADPRFCKNDVYLQESSPCLPENNDMGILIGALGAACEHCDYIEIADYHMPIDTVASLGSQLDYFFPVAHAENVTVVPENAFWQNDTLYVQLVNPGETTYKIYAQSYCDSDSTSITINFRIPGKLIVPDDYEVIQEAVSSARSGDTIYIRKGVYNGSGNRDLTIGNRSLVIMSEDGPEHTIINCQGNQNDPHYGFSIYGASGMYINMEGLTIKGAYSTISGGAILCRSGNLVIDNCRFIGNYAPDGGAILITGSTSSLTISNCHFSGNRAKLRGGAIYSSLSDFHMDNCILDGNKIERKWGMGGAIFLSGNSNFPRIKNCVLNGNYAEGPGGAIYCEEADLAIDSCILESNRSNESGGGICSVKSPLNLRNSDFINNYSDVGGCLFVLDRALDAQYCLFAGNEGLSYGGAIWVRSFKQQQLLAEIKNCTFAVNKADDGAAFYFQGSTKLMFLNSSICNNIAGKALHISYYSKPEFTCCNIFGNEAGDWMWPFEDQFGVNGNISADPRFCNPIEGDFHVASVSPCAPANNECNELIGALGVGCTPTDVDDEIIGMPLTFSLSQNYPNPFNAGTDIKYSIPYRSHVTIDIYNLLGQMIRTVIDEEKPTGNYVVTWDGTDDRGNVVASGIYFYRIKAGDNVDSRKMLLLK